MNGFLKLVVIGAVVISPLIFASEHEHEDNAIESTSGADYFKGLEPFDPQGSYELTLKQERNDALKAKTKLTVLKEQHGVDTVRSKSDSVKNDIYFRLANILPAGTIFRIVGAHDNNDGNVRVAIETKDILEITSISGAEILSIEEATVDLSAPKIVQKQPDAATLSLPTGEWNKEAGFQALSDALASGDEVVKASIVFRNTGNQKIYWENKPFASVIKALLQDNRGHLYGLGYSDDELAWWTQDITSSQLLNLYQNDLVINLIPR